MSKPIVPTQIRKVFEGRIFTVNVESITLPRGHHLDAEVIRHPGSVVLIPITDEGDIILVQQYRHPIGRSAWELPAGSLKVGEDPKAGALRECQEEPTPGYCDEEMHFYRAAGLRKPEAGDAAAHQDEDEDIEPKPFSLHAIRRMIASGEIIDMKTVAALTLLGPR
jgi:ADP-ribose pyrophosphatase